MHHAIDEMNVFFRDFIFFGGKSSQSFLDLPDCIQSSHAVHIGT